HVSIWHGAAGREARGQVEREQRFALVGIAVDQCEFAGGEVAGPKPVERLRHEVAEPADIGFESIGHGRLVRCSGSCRQGLAAIPARGIGRTCVIGPGRAGGIRYCTQDHYEYYARRSALWGDQFSEKVEKISAVSRVRLSGCQIDLAAI